MEFVLENKFIKVVILDVGATIYSFVHKETNKNIVLSYKDKNHYKTDAYGYFGTTVGRTAGRISNNSININDKTYNLISDNDVFLHGGSDGYSFKLFELVYQDSNKLSLHLTSNNDSGFPGTVNLLVNYSIHKETLKINYYATPSEDTPINITNHSYFNLDEDTDILSHKLIIHPFLYQEIDDKYIPTGKFMPVSKRYDFSLPLGKIIENCEKRGELGIDTYFFTPQKRLILKGSILSLKVKYNYPGCVLYTGNFFNNEELLNGTYTNHKGIAIEPQLPNDGYNLGYPNTLTKKGVLYKHSITYKVYKNK
jgi:aldose 1-epimerase